MIKIRNATVEDLPSMLQIYNNAILTTVATFDLNEQSMEERKAWFDLHGDQYPLIVAVKEGEVVGYCSLSPFSEKKAYSKTAELSIYISPEHRGFGIGTLLMKRILSLASERQFHTIISIITAGNNVSVQMHKKFGFEFAGRLKEVGFKFGKWLDVEYYQKML